MHEIPLQSSVPYLSAVLVDVGFALISWAVGGSILKSLPTYNKAMQMMMSVLCPQEELRLTAWCTGVAIGINVFQRYVCSMCWLVFNLFLTYFVTVIICC
jgi:hypothetical protein